MRRWNVVLTVVLVVVSALAVTGAAGAAGGKSETADEKVFNGNFCQPRYGTQVGDFRWYVRGIMNVSEEYREVSCPILKDDLKDNLATNLLHFNVILRKPVGFEYCCTLYGFDYWSNEVDSEEHCFPPEFQTIAVMHFYDELMGDYYGLYCNVPPLGWVLNYYLNERSPTDQDN